MGFSCGFVGLPNVGKSTIFNALSKGTAAAANFPFCTIEPNTGIVPVPDDRLIKLGELENSKKVVPTTIEFIDIAGLVEGASKGQGLGNQFLGHIRSVDAVTHVVRLFDDKDVVHVEGKLDATRDLELIRTELMLADLDFLEKKLQKSQKLLRSGDPDTKAELEFAATCAKFLNDGEVPVIDKEEPKEVALAQQLGLLCLMPSFVCANVDEDGLAAFGESKESKELIAYAAKFNMEVIPVCGKLEEELSQMEPEDAQMFLEDLGIKESGLSKVIHTGYKLLNYVTFFTSGPTESRAWTVEAGTPAPKASAKIHTDMQRGFIRMEVISYEHLVEFGGWNAAKSAGKLRIEGKEYIVKDGDSVFIRFNV